MFAFGMVFFLVWFLEQRREKLNFKKNYNKIK